MNTQSIKQQLRVIISRQIEVELENGMPDMQMAMTSLDFALASLDKVWEGNSPEEFVERYRRILENRFHRLNEDDAGEFGSGRDALGYILSATELQTLVA